jgi:hypothetical protein
MLVRIDHTPGLIKVTISSVLRKLGLAERSTALRILRLTSLEVQSVKERKQK